MKRLSLIATASLILVGCAGTQSDSNVALAATSQYEVDKQKMYMIEQAAKNSDKNIRVIWVNPPRKRAQN